MKRAGYNLRHDLIELRKKIQIPTNSPNTWLINRVVMSGGQDCSSGGCKKREIFNYLKITYQVADKVPRSYCRFQMYP